MSLACHTEPFPGTPQWHSRHHFHEMLKPTLTQLQTEDPPITADTVIENPVVVTCPCNALVVCLCHYCVTLAWMNDTKEVGAFHLFQFLLSSTNHLLFWLINTLRLCNEVRCHLLAMKTSPSWNDWPYSLSTKSTARCFTPHSLSLASSWNWCPIVIRHRSSE